MTIRTAQTMKIVWSKENNKRDAEYFMREAQCFVLHKHTIKTFIDKLHIPNLCWRVYHTKHIRNAKLVGVYIEFINGK